MRAVCFSAALAVVCACGGTGGTEGSPDAGPTGVGASSSAGGGPAGGGPGAGGGTGSVPSSGGASDGGSAGAAGSPPAGTGGGPAQPSGTPASIELLGGHGSALLESWPGATAKVRLRDAAGTPVANATVTWSVVSGEGANITSPGTPTDTTDENGIASRMLQGTGFNSSKPFGEAVLRATSSAGSVDFKTVTVHQVSYGLIGPYLALAEPQSFDLGTVKAGATLPAAAKLNAVVQAGAFTGTPLPNVALRFLNPSNPDEPPAANCAGGLALTNAAGVASCDLVVGKQLGPQTIAAFGGESTKFSAIHLTVVP